MEVLYFILTVNRLTYISGSIPERSGRCGERIYNTATVFGPDGSLLCIHRKIHLFDVDMPGELSFRESDNLSPGSKFCLFDTGKQQTSSLILYLVASLSA